MMIHTNADTAKKSIAILIPRVSNSISTKKGFYCFLVAFMFRLDKIVVVLVTGVKQSQLLDFKSWSRSGV